MIRISLVGLVAASFLGATLGCSDSSLPEREKDKTAVQEREQNLAKEKGGGKFMRPKGPGGAAGAPEGKKD
jgi:hypothetical protein